MRGCAAQKADDPGVTHVIVGDKPEGLQGLKPPKRAKVVQVSKNPYTYVHDCVEYLEWSVCIFFMRHNVSGKTALMSAPYYRQRGKPAPPRNSNLSNQGSALAQSRQPTMPCCRSHREIDLCSCVQSTWLEECLSQQKRVPEGSHLINVAAAIAQHIAGAHMAGSCCKIREHGHPCQRSLSGLD